MLELSSLDGGELEVVVAKRVADSGHVHWGEQERGCRGMSFVDFENPVYFYPENGVSDHVYYVCHEEAVDEIGHWEVIVEPVDKADFFGGEDGNLAEVEHHADGCGKNEQKVVPYFFELVVVFGKTHSHFFQLLHHIVQLWLTRVELQM